MRESEDLMDCQPFLINDVLLRQNPNDVQIACTYMQALEAVVPWKATANLHRLYVNFVRFYEEGGAVPGRAEVDLESARKVQSLPQQCLLRRPGSLRTAIPCLCIYFVRCLPSSTTHNSELKD
jgi:hypothetical protein